MLRNLLSVVEPPQTPTMGSKRGRLLMRQHRIKKESDLHADGDGHEPYRIERQHSEPTPNLLSVPSHSYLIKQNSSPHLTTPSPSASSSSSAPGHATGAPSSDQSQSTAHVKLRSEELRKIEDFRRTITSVPAVGFFFI